MKLLASTVSRSTTKGEEHGGLYVLDPETGAEEKVLEWKSEDIDWSGDGGERGLRGICFHGDHILVAANLSVLLLDHSFRVVGEIKHSSLRLCHEICICGDRLFITSTGCDAVVEYDMKAERFVRSVVFGGHPVRARFTDLDQVDKKNLWHINSIFHDGQFLYVSTGLTGDVFVLDDDLKIVESPRNELVHLSEEHGVKLSQMGIYLQRRVRTHNVYPFRCGYICNHSETAAVMFFAGDGECCWMTTHPFPSISMTAEERQKTCRWPRGLCWQGEKVYSGSFPMSVLTLDAKTGTVLNCVWYKNALRESVHGLELWKE